MPKHKDPDWSALLRDVRASGKTQAEIAAALGLSQASVSDLISGEIKSTQYAIGLKIFALHRAISKRKPAKVAV